MGNRKVDTIVWKKIKKTYIMYSIFVYIKNEKIKNGLENKVFKFVVIFICFLI